MPSKGWAKKDLAPNWPTPLSNSRPGAKKFHYIGLNLSQPNVSACQMWTHYGDRLITTEDIGTDGDLCCRCRRMLASALKQREKAARKVTLYAGDLLNEPDY